MTIYTTQAANDLDRHRGRWYGKYSGVVKDDKDPRKQGRLKVEVPSVWRGADPVWARPCFPPGHFFTPPVGAQVWIEFEAGDPAYPLWVGAWYPQEEVPAEAALEPPTSRVIATPSGHTVEFNDKEGEEAITVHHMADAFLSIDPKGSVVVGNTTGSIIYLNAEDGEVSVVSEQGHRVTLTGDGLALTHNDGSFVDVRADSVTVRGTSKVQVIARRRGGAVRRCARLTGVRAVPQAHPPLGDGPDRHPAATRGRPDDGLQEREGLNVSGTRRGAARTGAVGHDRQFCPRSDRPAPLLRARQAILKGAETA
jgi:hypothetical protein